MSCLVVQLFLLVNGVCERVQNNILCCNLNIFHFFVVLIADLKVVGSWSISEIDGLIMAIITLDDFFDKYHFFKLFLLLQSFLIFIQFEFGVDLSDEVLVTMYTGIEIAHIELDYHSGYLIGVGNIQFLFSTFETYHPQSIQNAHRHFVDLLREF